MSLRKIGFFILMFVVVFSSCKKDDDVEGTATIVIRDRGEQQETDKALLLDYLESHYYNSSDFDASNTNPKIKDLVITNLEGGGNIPTGSTLLKDAIEIKNTFFRDVDYEYYVLKLNQGGGTESPTFADNVSVVYEGFDLENEVFDSAITPVSFDLTSLIPGWRKVLTGFNTAESFIELGDGNVDYLNHGTGVMFLPSGLAYFSTATGGISTYESIIFKFEMYGMSENDHDGDSVPSYKEDLNNDGEFLLNTDADTLDGDDTDNDGSPNYFDADDDADGVLTINEDLEDTDLNFDSDGDGNPANDKNGDGDPTNDDTDGDGIPNYLDPDDTISKL